VLREDGIDDRRNDGLFIADDSGEERSPRVEGLDEILPDLLLDGASDVFGRPQFADCLCLVHAVVCTCPFFRVPLFMNSPSKTLILRFSSIGDIVLASPLLRVLRQRFPTAQIDFVTRTEYSELVRFNPNLNVTFGYDRRDGLVGLIRLARALRAERYDLLIDIHGSLRSRFLRILMGVPRAVTIDKRLRVRRALIAKKMNRYSAVVSVATRYIEPVHAYGVEDDAKGLELHIPDEILFRISGRMAALQLNRNEHVIGFCPSARHATKRWPAERYAELGIRLAKQDHARILLFGGPEDRALCGGIAETIDASEKGSVVDLTAELGLLETGAAMEFCDAIVTNDTGLMHIAAAKHRKLIALFGPTVREFGFFPLGEQSLVLEREGLYCRPCSHIGSATCPEGHFRCMQEISVDDVYATVYRLLS